MAKYSCGNRAEAGDFIECVNSMDTDKLTTGRQYTVEKLDANGFPYINGENWSPRRFKLIRRDLPPKAEEPERAETPDIIAEALAGHRSPRQKQIAEKYRDWCKLALEKNEDYGSTLFEVPELAPECSTDAAVRVRMSDKIGRIRKLLGGHSPLVKESLRDTIRDLGTYCLLLDCIWDDTKGAS